MNILRFLRPACIKLRLDFSPAEPEEGESEATIAARHRREKEQLIGELAAILAQSGDIANLPKFTRDLSHRERKATTAIAPARAKARICPEGLMCALDVAAGPVNSTVHPPANAHAATHGHRPAAGGAAG